MSRLAADFALVLAAACAFAGAAAAETREFAVAGFDKVSVSAGVSAEIAAGADGFSVVAKGDPEALDRLEIGVKGTELRVGRQSGMRERDRGSAMVVVTLPRLVGLDVSSGASAKARGVDADALSIESSSGAYAKAEGACGALEVDASSGSSIDAAGLECRSVDADASSGACVTVFAGESLEAGASSGGCVRYHGDPAQVRESSSSGGSVRAKG